MSKRIIVYLLIFATALLAKNHVKCDFIRAIPDRQYEYKCSNGQILRLDEIHVDVFASRFFGQRIETGEGRLSFYICPKSHPYRKPECGVKTFEKTYEELKALPAGEFVNYGYEPETMSDRYSDIPNCYSLSEYNSIKRNIAAHCKDSLLKEFQENEKTKREREFVNEKKLHIRNELQKIQSSNYLNYCSVYESHQAGNYRLKPMSCEEKSRTYHYSKSELEECERKLSLTVCDWQDSSFAESIPEKISQLFSDETCFNMGRNFDFLSFKSEYNYKSVLKCYKKIEADFDDLINSVSQFIELKTSQRQDIIDADHQKVIEERKKLEREKQEKELRKKQQALEKKKAREDSLARYEEMKREKEKEREAEREKVLKKLHEKEDRKTSIELHPVSLILYPLLASKEFFYVTIENSISRQTSIISRPFFKMKINDDDNLIVLGISEGIRYYLFWMKSGQSSMTAPYAAFHVSYEKGFADISGNNFGAGLYIGSKIMQGHFSGSFDIGATYNKFLSSGGGYYKDAANAITSNGPNFELNFTTGYAF